MLRNATLRQLKAFALVAVHHSFAQAAAELHLTPSAVSLQIKELERGLGLQLFDRQGKGVLLTRAGSALLPDVHRVLAALQLADNTLCALRDQQHSGFVSVGMIAHAEYFVPQLLARFRASNRNVELRLLVGNREQMLDKLRRNEVDLAVMGAPPGDMQARASAFASQPLGIVGAPSHVLAGKRALPLSALAAHEFIVREPGSGTRAAMDRLFRQAQIGPPSAMECSSNEAVKRVVMANMGLAFVPLHSVAVERRRRWLAPIDVVGLPLMRRWHVVSVGSAPLSGSAQDLHDYIVLHGEEVIARALEQDPPTGQGPYPAEAPASLDEVSLPAL